MNMNILNGGCVIRYSKLWASLWWKNLVTSALHVNLDEVQSIKTPCCKNFVTLFDKTRCFGKQIPSLIPWTQVRFNKDYSKFHRDLPFPNFADYRKEKYKDVTKTYWGLGVEKTGFTYVVGFFGVLCGSYALKSELTRYITYMGTAADVLAMASIQVDISKIAPGACLSYKWRGKPLFIKHRTQADIDTEAKTPMSALRDPQTPEQRTTNPEWLIVIGICTHLGCVPIPNSGDWDGGFYCPCHGSHYDNVGRARKGPAPLNLEVPPYKFVSDTVVLVG